MRILNLIIFPLTLIIGILLCAAGLAMFVPPKISSWIPLLGLLFPFLFLLNLLFLIYWWVQLKLKMILPLCFAIFNLLHASKYVQYSSEKSGKKRSFTLATYNAQLFGVMANDNFFERVKEYISGDSMDILCLQEVYLKDNLKKGLSDLSKAGNFRTYDFFRLEAHRPYGMAVFSRYPILRSGKINIGNNTGNMAIWADLLMQGDTVRLYNLHLQSIRFNRKDYEFIQQTAKNDEGGLEGSKNLLRRIQEAYIKRSEQADSVTAHMASCTYPVLVAGDFNDVPLSYAYHTIGKDMRDAFCERGRGFERTYKGPFPNFRIDYILFSKRFICTDYQSISNIPGDHKMVSAGFYMPGEP